MNQPSSLSDLLQLLSEGCRKLNTTCRSLNNTERDVNELENRLKKVESLVADLRSLDAQFHERLKGKDVSSLMAKKMKSDYDTKLEVQKSLKNASNWISKCKFAITNAKRSQAPAATQAAPPKAPPSNTIREESFQYGNSTQMLLIREYDEKMTNDEEHETLRRIAQTSSQVREMASEIGSILHVQQDDINKLDQNNEESVSKAIDGVNELTRAKKRQASSGTATASIGSAALGGLVGMLGGPIGVVIGVGAGALVGYGTGRGVAAVKQRSIDAEIRRIKALLGSSHKLNKAGERCIEVRAFEVQSWSMLERQWMPYKWVNENGGDTDLYPSCTIKPSEARNIVLEVARAGVSSESDEMRVMKASVEEEVALRIQWSWMTPKWHIVMDREECDIAGWEYATSTGSTNWQKDASRTCMARRRMWVQYLMGALPPTETTGKLATSRTRTTGNQSTKSSDSQREQLMDEIMQNSIGTNEIMTNSLAQVHVQGEQITRSDRNAAIVGDISEYAERIERASRLAGALHNMLSWPTSKTEEADYLNEELDRERQERAALQDTTNQQNDDDDATDSLSITARTMEQNLRISKSMKYELDIQNVQLDRTAESMQHGNSGMLRITKSIVK